MKKWYLKGLALFAAAALFAGGCGTENLQTAGETGAIRTQAETGKKADEDRIGWSFFLEDIPEFSGDPYVVLSENVPLFSQEDFSEESYETYSALDGLGRCGVAEANIGEDLMPTAKRESISQVKPSGWHSVQYDWVEGKSLYNRCHLIGYQLTAENANEKNLITGTRFLNVEGMLPFENMVADYIKETGNHVLYRVTPVYQGNELVARGVRMEGWSVEDEGEGICFHVYAYNEQPGVVIDYATGESREAEGGDPARGTAAADTSQKERSRSADRSEGNSAPEETESQGEYILNTNTKKFHLPSCSSAEQISGENRESYSGSREELLSLGYDPCKRCEP